MPKSYTFAAVSAIAIAMILVYLRSNVSRQSTPEALEPHTTSPIRSGSDADPDVDTTTTTPSPSESAPTIDQTNTDARFTRFTDGSVHLRESFTASRKLHQATDPRADLGIIEQLIGDYRLIYRENPVGTDNAEIIEQLRGANPKNVVFIDPSLSALTADGQLLDRWGSPFIFHPLTSTVMDIRSMGPDRKPWTSDDLSLDLQETEEELGLHPDK